MSNNNNNQPQKNDTTTTYDTNDPNNNKSNTSKKFSFWVRISEEMINNQLTKTNINTNEYESQVKKLAEFDSIEEFWKIYQHIKKPDACRPGIDIQLFKNPIKPMWEDDYNKNGGRLSLKLRKDFSTIIWEEILLAMIGNILPKEISDEINGVLISVKKKYNGLQIWFKDYNNKITIELERCIRDLIQIPQEVPIEIKKFFNDNKYNNWDKSKNEKNNEEEDIKDVEDKNNDINIEENENKDDKSENENKKKKSKKK